MKEKRFTVFLGVEALLCLLACALLWALGWEAQQLFSFPFAQLGVLLRQLSLSGGAGNAAATGSYVLLCLIPAACLLPLWRRKRLRPEDALLVLLSGLLFPVLYLAVNPGLIASWLGVPAEMGLLSLGATFYAVLAGYLALRLLRWVQSSEVGSLHRTLRLLLGLLGCGFVLAAFGVDSWSLLHALETLRESNAGYESQLGWSYCFLVLGWLCDVLACLLDVAIIGRARRLLAALALDRYSDESVELAGQLSHLCARVLRITVLVNVAYVLLQLAFMGNLRSVSTTVQLPLISIAFVLATLLLTRYLQEGRQLKQDNDLFI